MARSRRFQGRGNPLPFEGLARTVVSLLAVGLLAAGVGYGLGLYLTGALSSGSSVAENGSSPPDSVVIDMDVDQDSPSGEEPDPGLDQAPGPEETNGGPDETEATPVTAPASREVSVAPVMLYGVQLGVFSNAENAQVFVQELNSADIAGAVVQVDGYRVWTGMFVDRDSARQLAEQLQALGYEAFVTERRIGYDVLLQGSSAETLDILADAIARLPGYMWETAAMWSPGSGVSADTPLMERLRETAGTLDRLPDSAGHQALKNAYNRLISMVAAGSRPVDPADGKLGEAASLLAEVEQVFRVMASNPGN